MDLMNDKIEALKELKTSIRNLCREYTEKHGGSIGVKKENGYIDPTTGKEVCKEKINGVRVTGEFGGIIVEV